MKKNIVVAFVVCLMAGIAVTACGDIETGIPNGDCFNGEKKNDENVGKLICKEGKWVKDGAEVGNVCTEENSENSEAGKLIKPDGKEEYCIIGGKKVSCKSESECGECMNGASECRENMNYICEDGRWKKTEEVCGGNVCIEEKNSQIGSVKNEKCQSGGESVSCNKDKSDCGVCLNGKYKCEVLGKERKKCEDGEWKPSGTCECPNWGDVVNNSACLIYGEDLKWFACSGNMKGQTKFEDKLFCSNNKWYECKSDAHLNAVVGKMACVKIDGVYKWTKCNNTDDAKGRENDDKILCNGIDWKVCEKNGTSECVRKNNYGKLYICDGNKWSDKTCDVDCNNCN